MPSAKVSTRPAACSPVAPKPRFEFGNFYTIVFPRPGQPMPKSGKKAVETGEWGEKWGENERRTLELIGRNPKVSTTKLVKELGLSPSGIEKILGRLKAEGTLTRIGPAKGGYWQIQLPDNGAPNSST